MGCCGQKRAAIRARSTAPIAPPPAPAAATPPARPLPLGPGEVAVAYHGAAAALLHRGASGTLYVFSHDRPVRAMAPQDAAQLSGRADFELRVP